MEVKGLNGKIDQSHGSAETSLNQVPALMKRVSWRSGTKNLDVGGGKYEAATDYLRSHGVRNIVFDPFNRETAHNRAVYAEMRDGGVDTVTCCNVLNVIDGAKARQNVILQCAKALKSGGVAYFSVYEGDKSGVGRRTKADCWQNNRRTESYVGEIERSFGKVDRHGQVIEARKPIVTERKSEWNMDSEGKESELFGIKRTTTKTNRTMATKKQLDALAKGRKMLAEKRKGEKGKKGKKESGVDGIGMFGEQFTQFKGKPKQAIRYLMKVKRGECIAALHRDDIGDIDIVWGKVTDPNKHTGYGLAHIIEKHGKTIKELGFEVEDFVPIVVQYGNFNVKESKDEKYVFESKMFRFVIKREWNGIKKQLLLTAFDLRKKP